MTERAGQLAGLARRHRTLLIVVAASLLSYALLGFFLAPHLVEKNAVETVRDDFGAELRFADVAVNPFVLSLRMDGIELDDPSGHAVARIGQVFINFQLSSLFRWALTFDEIRIDDPELFASRNGGGDLNLAFLAAGDAPDDAPPEDETGDDAALLRLLVFDFAINGGVVQWNDEVPAEPVETRFGPVDIRVAELNTLPQRAGQQEVVITTETAGTLSWSGSLQLQPLDSAGHAEIRGPHFPLVSAYVRHDLGFDFVDGATDIALDYSVSTEDDGSLRAAVDNLAITFSDVTVNTFNVANDAAAAATDDREVLSMPSLRLSGGTLRWPEQQLAIASLEVDDTVLRLFRDATGALDIVPADDETAAGEAAADPAADDSPWSITLDRLAVGNMSVGLIDHSVQPNADIGVDKLNIVMTGISNQPGASFPTEISMDGRHGGTISLAGALTVLPEHLAEFDVTVDGLVLEATRPYIRPLADVNLEQGALNLQGKLLSSAEQPLQLTADLDVVDFLITETDEGSRLGSWDRVLVADLALDVTEDTLEISEIRFEKPYADVFIAEDGSANLGRVAKDGSGADEGEGADETAEAASDADTDETTAATRVTIGRVIIEDGAADFADFSLPLPFDAKIAELNGDLTTIATTSQDPSTVGLEGKVDEYGLVGVSGTVTPLDPARNTDLRVVFENVEVPKFSAYTIRFAGREIASGKLDLDLGYQIKGSELVGENSIVLREFELGEKVPHPDAMSLPLGLAVALLKDPSGKIDIDLPVRGNVDDPEFGYGRVVLKALANLIVKIVASPFALLGNLLGVEANDLEYLNFVAGRADLTPPESERAAKLAEALAMRPQLVLQVPGVVDRERDGFALRTLKLDQLLEERVAALQNEEADGQLAEQQQAVLEALYAETAGGSDAGMELAALREEYTTSADVDADANNGDAEPQFDAVAYANELRRQLIEWQEVTEEELATLANQRAGNTREAIIGINPQLEERVMVGKPQAVEGDEDEPVKMKVTLTADGAEPASPVDTAGEES